MADFNTPLTQEQARTPPIVPKPAGGPTVTPPLQGLFDDEEILALWKTIKAETIDDRQTDLRQSQRNLYYILGRQWIEYQAKYGGWRDKRMATFIPRPVTNKCKETVQAIRAMFTSINLNVNVRPNGSDPKNVSAAATADELAPLLHEVHFMDQAMSEFDFWLCATGNAFLHTYVDYDIKHGQLVITAEQCAGCGSVQSSKDLVGAQPVCPDCGGNDFSPAMDPTTGAPVQTTQVKGVPATVVLSQLELSFPRIYTRFDDLPYVVRSRWRTKHYYENHPDLKDLVGKISWQKSPRDNSLALFTSLSQTNDLGVAPSYLGSGSGQTDEGISEHEVWMKPSEAYPEGLVFRIIDDADGMVVHLEELENLPGPLPYKDADGNALFTFAHGQYEHVGGRILASGPLDQIIEKQDQLNQLDSFILLCLGRTANPVWLEPKGCEVQKLTGVPGLVIKYKTDPMSANSKPERLPGIPLDASWMQLREQYLRDIEELAGTFDIIKGQKPAGVEAFSALQLLVERSQARFSSVFKSRGNVYKNWFKFAVELEREFGPDERTKAVLTPARAWTFQTFQRAQLQGSLSVVVEDGSTTPKTSLGMRASVEHANSLGMLNMQDPDQQYEGLKLFGLTRMVPTLDIHVQAALQKQQAFEEWVVDPANLQAFVMQAQQQQQAYAQQMDQYGQQQAATNQQMAGATDPNQPMPPAAQPPPAPPSPLEGTPLKWYPWFSAQVHLQEFLKWANDDHVRQLIKDTPIVANLLTIHMQEMMANMPQPPVAPGQPPPAQGGGKAMGNSNTNSAAAGNSPQPSHA